MFKVLLNKQDSYALRGICMLLIILHHTYFKWINYDGFNHWIGYVFLGPIGYLSTGLFFFLSGYGLYNSMIYNMPLSNAYLFFKIRKMLFVYIYAFTSFVLLALIFNNKLLSYQMLLDFFTLTMPFTVTWFFKVIIGLYVISFCVFKFLRDQKQKVYSILGLVLIYICVARKYLPSYWYDSVLNFPVGMLFAFYINKINKISSKRVIINALFCSIICICFFRKDLFLVISSLLFTILAIYVIRFVNIESSILGYVGVNSLCFYLFQSIFLKHCELIYFNMYSYTLSVFILTFIWTVLYVRFTKDKIN